MLKRDCQKNTIKLLRCTCSTPSSLTVVTKLGRRFGGGSGLIVKFYHRDDDKRARILCRSPRNSGSSKYSCLPLNSLTIRRPESSSSLQLCRRTGSGLDLWANMKFTTIES
jgi:hypothetical protein